MAEAAIFTAVINQAVQIGANLIVETGSRLYNLKENTEWIERKMRHFHSCLKDAELKQDGSHEVANLITDMRDLALDIEDILDTYIPKIARKGPFRRLKHDAFVLKIEKIKERAQEIEAARERCQVNADRDGGNAESEVWNRRKEFLVSSESMVVGREDTLHELEEKLRSSSTQCKMICVVGEAGVGKTTVAKKIYTEMQNEFTSSALVYVSNEPRVQELLLEIAKQVGLEKEKMDENLKVNLLSLINEKKCLIFLDDIWTTEAWDELKNIIPIYSRNQSRIIITSRYTDVGRYIGGEGSLVELKLLDQEKSWELFSKLIKPSSENTIERFLSIELEDIARKIVERCGGLPLAIVVAVGMLRQRRRNKYAWNEVLDNLSTSAENNCSKLLSLSYKDLPPDLRPFFLYFGLFPEDQEIFASDLVSAWVTEKLIQVDGIRNPDEIGAAKLETLCDRNLIQVSRRSMDGRVKCCRIHDLLHVLCIKIAKEDNFFCTCHNIISNPFSTLRRLTIDTSQYSVSNSRTPKLRSLLYFDDSRGWSLIPNEIGDLHTLTYLKLSGRFERMPSTIENLKKLATLDMKRATFNRGLPRTILRMKNLKHLFMCEIFLFNSKKENFYVRNEVHLPNIETLDGFRGEYLKPHSLQKLSNLRKLRMRWFNNKHINVISGTTPISGKLQDLRLLLYKPSTRLNMSRYHHLAKLHLDFNNEPCMFDTIEFPPNLINLTLQDAIFNEDPIKVLKELPRLEILKLKGSSEFLAQSMDFTGANSFPELQVLAIQTVEMPELIVNQTGMPKLYNFVSRRAYLNVPERLREIMVVKPCRVVRLLLNS